MMRVSEEGGGYAPIQQIASRKMSQATFGMQLKGHKRARLIILFFLIAFSAVGVRLGQLTIGTPRPVDLAQEADDKIPRPEIVDRNGELVATDIQVASLFADPRKIIDIDEAVEQLTANLPRLKADEVRRKLSDRNRAFTWLARQISPDEQAIIHNLGIPGIGFRWERQRIYPKGRLAGHLVGFVDIDSRGIAGMERYLDDQGQLLVASLADPLEAKAGPVTLALDVRVQHAMTEELQKAKEKFSAVAAAGVVMDVNTGEILAMSSIPDFNPNDPVEALQKDRINRLTTAVYEMGSTFKTVTFAMCLDAGVSMQSRWDARGALVIGRSRIGDFRAENRVLSLPEVFTYSSNIGTARMALDQGIEKHQAFLRKLGFFGRMRTEIPESAAPLVPARWGKISTATIAFGHGMSVAPLQLLSAVAAFMNGGKLIPPTFLKRDPELMAGLGEQVIKPETSDKMRYLLRLNGQIGSAKKADVKGYRVGGKTGSAEKVVNGQYSKGKNVTNFIAGFPMEKPQYLVFVLLDEPNALKETYGFRTSGWNAVPTGGKIIERIAPLLGVLPKFDDGTTKGVAIAASLLQ
ncbi:cell division protein FtsI (penicillin-binding protein 3) [Rhodoligotrophos appendicifer]|uniref:peptidoglycan D,D-transpeptidase FtsI family protein n=1 Tax=Rhodoligotrophos appendicifer TaxID=987056 RepID=UPI001185156E|nr:penicillin-binding protein 2 [Rhodoligotrophos appendicifer]